MKVENNIQNNTAENNESNYFLIPKTFNKLLDALVQTYQETMN